jgi:hypothetical protein
LYYTRMIKENVLLLKEVYLGHQKVRFILTGEPNGDYD